ncbi:MAG: hypothetical protein HY461_01600 [Parcubacteria group bacterium]|nr:hypothetical protein [Parcubacteria group bacterium]
MDRDDDYYHGVTRRGAVYLERIRYRKHKRRQLRQRKPIDLTIKPARGKREVTVNLFRLGDKTDCTSMLNWVRQQLHQVIKQRPLDPVQADVARRTLGRAATIIVERIKRRGLVFSWTSQDGTTYYLVVHEDNALTKKIDRMQKQFAAPARPLDATTHATAAA